MYKIPKEILPCKFLLIISFGFKHCFIYLFIFLRHIACEDGEVGCALTLIANGASVEIENKDKLTPLDVCKPNIRRQILDKIKKE